jgi:hypothetical protein
MPYQVRREGFNKWRRSGASSRVETGKVDLQGRDRLREKVGAAALLLKTNVRCFAALEWRR